MIPGEATMLPGFIRFSGSKARLSSRNARMSVAPYIRSRNGLRARPSPCSLEIVPLNSTTRSVISSAISFPCVIPRAVLMLIAGRMCRQPTEQWP